MATLATATGANSMPHVSLSVPPSSHLSHNLQLAFTNIHNQLEAFKQTLTHVQASELNELEKAIQALNTNLIDEVRAIVKENVREQVQIAVKEAMDGLVLRIDNPGQFTGSGPHTVTVHTQSHENGTVPPFVPSASKRSSISASWVTSPNAVPYPPTAPHQNDSIPNTLHANLFLPQHPSISTPPHPSSSFATGSSAVAAADGHVSPTDCLGFSMSRDVKTVPDLWREYTVGWDGQPPVRDIYEGSERKRRKGKRFRDDSERKFYRRRKKVLELVETLVDRGCTDREAAERVERLRDRRRVTLNKLGEIIPEMTPEELALV
ncbi:uncharacterized protein L203_102936 [Cryptococcus depauperatus CBS 7841]|uniref:Uncharacterized protein n=1 Tax=Cryptococcus depauperatus CBS 7841 TaxID=1295531 RepID=A0A1E3IQ10_9TREE|nr:hypothetical protein L203_01796 [Cryptococcus depauperatus CBS 7841]ODO03988.1 hypothetical protein L204_00330 [Cryptococcus depauperatus CBS 7855]